MSIIGKSEKLADITIGYFYLIILKFSAQVKLNGNVKIRGRLIVDLHKNAKLQIGKNVTLNSSNNGYHVNMYAPVKLFADMDGASIEIGNDTRIHGTCIHAYQSIKIGSNCLIAANSQIIDCSGHDLSFDDVQNRINTKGIIKPIAIGDNVWIGAGCTILPGVTIGNGSIIGANSTVTKNIPAMCIAAGNPAKVLRVVG